MFHLCYDRSQWRNFLVLPLWSYDYFPPNYPAIVFGGDGGWGGGPCTLAEIWKTCTLAENARRRRAAKKKHSISQVNTPGIVWGDTISPSNDGFSRRYRWFPLNNPWSRKSQCHLMVSDYCYLENTLYIPIGVLVGENHYRQMTNLVQILYSRPDLLISQRETCSSSPVFRNFRTFGALWKLFYIW